MSHFSPYASVSRKKYLLLTSLDETLNLTAVQTIAALYFFHFGGKKNMAYLFQDSHMNICYNKLSDLDIVLERKVPFVSQGSQYHTSVNLLYEPLFI